MNNKEIPENDVPKVERQPVELGQVATDYKLVFQTPDGNFTHEEYLVWMGNKLVEIKEALAG